jgi:hypothetical protein
VQHRSYFHSSIGEFTCGYSAGHQFLANASGMNASGMNASSMNASALS